MNKRKATESCKGGVSRPMASACGSSLPCGKLLNILIAIVLCCGLMIPTTLTRTQAFADPSESAAEQQEETQPAVEGETEGEASENEAVAFESAPTIEADDQEAPVEETATTASNEVATLSDEAPATVCEIDGYSVSARHTGTTDDDAVQYVDFVINPGYGSVTVTDADALAQSFAIVNADGSPNSRYTSVSAKVSDDGDSIVVTGQLNFALMDGIAHVRTVSPDGIVAGCTAETYVRGSGYVQAPVKFDGIDTVVPSGLNFTAVSYVPGTETVPASTTFKLTGKANVRSMNHVIWMSNGASIIPSNGAATNAGYSQTTVAHQHNYLSMTEADAVASIVSNAYNEEGSRTLAQYGYSIKDNEDGSFTVTADSPKAGEVIDASVYDDNFLQANGLDMDTPLDDKTSLPAGPATIVTTEIRSRAASDPATASIALKNVGSGWAEASKTMKVAWLKDGQPSDEQTLTDQQWALSGSTIKVTRTADDPVFETTKDDATADDPYIQERMYRVTIEADGFPAVTKDIRFYTNYNSGALEIREKDGSDNSAVTKTVDFTEEQVNDMLTFQNGSSSCGHTGVRTFSGMGVPITTLLEKAGITFEPGDTLKMRCTDGDGDDKYYWRGGTWTYEELLENQRYFLSSLYTDDDVQNLFIEAAANAAEAPENTAFRQAAAAAENTPMDPMISTGYVETMLDASNIKDAELPTEANTKDKISSLVGKENNFRFIYGITMTDQCTVSFDAGEGVNIKPQTVKGSKLMTSTPEQENTTMSSCYWVIGFDIIKGSHTPEAEDTTPSAVTKPADPTREGYTFGGWFTDEACTQAFDFSKQVDSDTTLHAKWTVNPATIPTENVEVRLRGESPSISLTDVTATWADANKTVTVVPLKDGSPLGNAVTLNADQWDFEANSRDATKGWINFHRTDADPIFTTDVDDGSVTKDGDYKRIRTYRVTITTEDGAVSTADLPFYTQYNDGAFEIRVKSGSAESSATETVKITKEDVEALMSFQSGSSSCGMTGVRTFSGYGATITDLLKKANIDFEPGDTLKMRCTDGDGDDKYYWRGGTWTYEDLLGKDRYFLSSLYTDPSVQQKFIEAAANPEEAPENAAFRKAVAAAQNTKVVPMISTGYVETMLDSENIQGATLPTEANTKDQISGITGQENNFRFIYGITMTNDKHTVSFDAGNGSSIASQTVNGPLMTSTPEQENTTMSSCYWVIGFDIIKGSHTPEAEDTTPSAVTKPADPTREGYTFGGWFTDEACTQAFDFDAAVEADVTLHAKWIANGGDPTPERPSTGTKTDPATGVAASGSVLAPGGSAADGSLKVSEMLSSSDRFQELKSKYAPANNLLFKVFDVSLQNLNGVEITDLGADGLTLTFPVGAEYNGKPGTIIHLHKNADGTVSEQRSADGQKVVDGKLSISGVKSFSEFVVMVNDNAATAGGNASGTTLTKTGDSLPVVPIACFGGAAVLLLALAMLSRRRTGGRD